jgi:hypothetical protein
MTLSINDTERNNALHYAMCRYAEVDFYLQLCSVIMLSVVMLGAVAPPGLLYESARYGNRTSVRFKTKMKIVIIQHAYNHNDEDFISFKIKL